jgi:hypothetical protein
MASIPIIAPSPSSRILYRENQLRVTPTSLLALTPDPPAGGRHSNSRDRPPGPASFPANHGVVRRATQCLSPPMLEEEHMYGLFGASPTVAARIWLIAKVGEHRWANEEVTRSWPQTKPSLAPWRSSHPAFPASQTKGKLHKFGLAKA